MPNNNALSKYLSDYVVKKKENVQDCIYNFEKIRRSIGNLNATGNDKLFHKQVVSKGDCWWNTDFRKLEISKTRGFLTVLWP